MNLSALLGCRPAESRPFWLLLGHYFFLGLSLAFYRIVANTLFLITHGASALPVVYLLAAVIAFAVILIVSRLQPRLPGAALPVAGAGLLLVFMVLSRLGFRTGDTGSVIFAIQVGSIVMTLAAELAFWTLAGQLFDFRHGKRLFPSLLAGDFVANILAGLAMYRLSEQVAIEDCLYVCIASQSLALVLLVYFAWTVPRARLAVEGPPPETDAQPQSLGTIVRDRFLVLLLTVNGLVGVGFYGVDFAFLDQAAGRFTDAQALARFFGVFSASAGIVNLGALAVLTGWFIRRCGIQAGLVLLPGILLVIYGSLVLIGQGNGDFRAVFWLILLSKLITVVLTRTVQKPALRILYQLVPAVLRTTFRAVVEGLVPTVMLGLAGLLLWLETRQTSFPALTTIYGLVVVSIVWLVLAVALGKAFGKALRACLDRPRANAHVLTLGDGSSQGIIRRWLGNSDALEVMHALQVLERAEDAAVVDGLLVALLDHPEPTVRREVLDRIEQYKLVRLRGRIAVFFKKEAHPPIKGSALRVLIALSDHRARQALLAYLENPDPLLRQGALVGFLRHGGDAGIRTVSEQLAKLTHSKQPAKRALAADVLGQMGSTALDRLLVPLLTDADLTVRRSALRNAGKIGSAALWPGVLANLSVPSLRSLAVITLAAAGSQALPAVQAALDQEKLGVEEHIALLRISQRLGGPWAVRLLLSRLDHVGPAQIRVRREACQGLVRLGFIAKEKGKEARLAQIHHQGVRAGMVLAALRDLQDEAPEGPLSNALAVELRRCVDDMLLLLSLVYPADSIDDVRRQLENSNTTAQHALGVQTLENLLPVDLKRIMLPLVENLAITVRFDRLRLVYPQSLLGLSGRVKRIVESQTLFSAWTRACALYEIGDRNWQELRETVVQSAKDDDAFVRETAQWALQRLERGSVVLPILERVLFLKNVGLFKDIQEDDLVSLASHMREREYAAGVQIIKEGDTGREMYIIVEGKARVHKGDQQLALLASKEVFGELAALDPQPRSASVTVLEECRLLELDHTVLLEEVMSNNELARGIIRFLVQRFRNRPSQ